MQRKGERESWHKSQMIKLVVTEPQLCTVENLVAGTLWEGV